MTAAAGIHSDSWQIYQHEVAQAASRGGCSFCRAGLPPASLAAEAPLLREDWALADADQYTPAGGILHLRAMSIKGGTPESIVEDKLGYGGKRERSETSHSKQ